jgi:uncharacterized oxidoreductase
LAEALHERKNQVIIASRRKDRLTEVAKANPGMAWAELDIEDPESISTVTKKLTAEYPKLNVLINNAGIMNIDDVSTAVDERLLVSTLTTNLMGPIRMTGAMIEHLKHQTHAAVINTTSVIGFVPMAIAAVYSSTKAAMHSYTLSLRYKLKDTPVKVLEIAPPWVQTDLLGSNNEPRAMPLVEFIEETMRVLGTDADEVLVERAKPLRSNVGPHETAFVTQFNDMMQNLQ